MIISSFINLQNEFFYFFKNILKNVEKKSLLDIINVLILKIL